MKRFPIVFLMVMFLVNTVVVSAWAKTCIMNDTEMSQISSNSDMGDMPPCHEENNKEKQDPTQCCEGVCLCLHMSQKPMLYDLVTILDISSGIKTFKFSNESTPSQHYSPTNPPPIFNT